MKKQDDRWILWCAGGAFAVLLTAWAVLFTVAARHRVATVPLATQPAR